MCQNSLVWLIFWSMPVYHILFIHSYFSGHLCCFPLLAIVNNAAVWMLVYKYLCVHLCFHFLWIYIQRWDLLDHMVIPFNFLRNFHPVFHSDYTILYSHWWCMKVLYCFFLLAVPWGVWDLRSPARDAAACTASLTEL